MCIVAAREQDGYFESSSSNKTIHSTQYNTSQSPPQLTTISLVLSSLACKACTSAQDYSSLIQSKATVPLAHLGFS